MYKSERGREREGGGGGGVKKERKGVSGVYTQREEEGGEKEGCVYNNT